MPMTTTGTLLQYVLGDPSIIPAIRALDASEVAALIGEIGEIGLEDAGEVLEMVTHDQFVQLIDDSLWIQESGEPHERFDHSSFATWLEVLSEGGPGLVAERLHNLPEETLFLAFSGHLLVLDIETLGIGMAASSAVEAEIVEKALDACLYLEFGNFTLIARRSYGWDAVIDALLVLDRVDHGLTTRLLTACVDASAQRIDNDGLSQVLSAAETLEEDAAAGREHRRERRGYVTPADAASFLALAELTSICAPCTFANRDPISSAYFRELDRPEPGITEPPSQLLKALTSFGVLDRSRPQPALGEGLARSVATLTSATRRRFEHELAYIANLLVASDLRLSPIEAAEEAIRVCSRGIEALVRTGIDPQHALTAYGADQLFRIAWHRRRNRVPTLSPFTESGDST